ncbi:AAA family ATPase [Allopontixanthobacter sp.]|uniref:AAA family ATPase n=1 Tax=Allopontixanthobacter sp. TaxID=2906452 RepID=UPI002ABC8976|nr:AAA family ATPase [Allopontixanthobacter sp.]MDZ4308403.1 AAA family ATPase [Allopontixanthobacter sp.]
MINPRNFPVDIEEVRMWAVGYREMREPVLSWASFSKECGIPAGTLQPFCAGKYQGDNMGIARKIFQFMQAVDSRNKRQDSLPTDPGYFETDTSVRIQTLLQIAHMGRITVAATGPGTGKSITINDYAERAQPCWIATMKPSTSRLIQMVLEVHKALGMEPRHLVAAQASRIVIDRVKGRNGLLIIDEANHLSIEAIEEIRSWHDETGVGICMLGNEELLARIETGRHKDQFSRLNSRIAHKHWQRMPTRNDVYTFCDAWGVVDPGIRKYLEKIALTPDAGGLRECKQLIEAGSMIAATEERGLSVSDLRDAQMTRATRWIAA